MTEEEMQAEIERLTNELTTVNSNSAKLVKEKRDALTRAEKAEADAEEAAETARTETGSELDKANRRIAKLEKERDDANARADKSDKGLRDYKASSALSEAIAKANVDAAHVGLLTKALRNDIEFDDAGDPTIEGKSITDYTKAFFANEGKSYVRAADHSGGGATGSDGAKPPKRWSKVPETGPEWAEFNNLPKEERNAICDQLGVPNLKVA